jgi:hypothetical protein
MDEFKEVFQRYIPKAELDEFISSLRRGNKGEAEAPTGQAAKREEGNGR